MDNVVRIQREDNTIKKADVINFPNVKLKKDGTPKQTPNNSKVNRDNVYPFKEEDIPKMVKYFKNRIDIANNKEDEMIARRDLSLYIMGLNIGLRVSDLVSLKWSDIYNDDWTFRTGKSIAPKKTRKSNRPKKDNEKPKQDKHILLKFNDDFRKAIDYYRQYCDIKDINSYIFLSREVNSNKKNNKKEIKEHICEDTVGYIIKKAAKEVGIKYNVRTHSLRKTFCRLRYDHSNDKSKTLVELMVLLGHSSPSVTKHYICVSEEELEALYNDVSIGFDSIFD